MIKLHICDLRRVCREYGAPRLFIDTGTNQNRDQPDQIV